MTKSISDFAGFHGAMDSNSAFKTSASSSVTERRADLSAFHLTRRAKKKSTLRRIISDDAAQPASRDGKKSATERERFKQEAVSGGCVWID